MKSIVGRVLISCFVLIFGFTAVVSAADTEAERFAVALKAFSDGFYDAALSLFKRIIEDYPEGQYLTSSKLYSAKCYYFKEDYKKALEIFESVIKSNVETGKLIQAYYWSALVYFKGKDFDKTIAYTEKIIDNFKDAPLVWKTHYLLADTKIQLNEIDQANELLLKVIEESTDPELLDMAYAKLLNLYYNLKKYPKIISLAQEYLRQFPNGIIQAKIYFYLAESYYWRDEWDRALGYYRKALELNRDDDLADLIHQGIGLTYLANNEKVKAKLNIDKIKDKQLRHYSQGVYYFRTNDYIQALEVLTIFIRENPDSHLIADAYLNKADLLYEMGRINDAISNYRYILEKFNSGENSDAINKAHYGLAWCYLKNGKFKKAIDEFKNTLEYANNAIVKVSSQIQIADAYQETGKYDQALTIYNEILNGHPNTVYADYIQFQTGICFLKKNDLSNAFLALKNLRNNFPSSRLISQAQYYLAVGYFSQEDYAQAKSLLRNFIEKFPTDELLGKVYYLYGKCFFNEKKYQEALKTFKQIPKYGDQDIQELSYIDIGNIYLNLSEYTMAKKIWKKFLSKYPNSQYAGIVGLYLGGLYEKENNYSEAEFYYKKVIQDYKNSDSAQEALFSLGHLYWNQDNTKKAINYFQKLAQRKTSLGLKGKFYLAKIFAHNEQNQKAFQIYDELINTEGEMSQLALSAKAFLLKDTKKYQQAIDYFKTAISKGLDNPEIRFALGFCLEKTDQNLAAIEEYFKAIYAFSNQDTAESSKNYEVKAYFRIAKIYEKNAMIEEAKKIYKKIIDSDFQEKKIAQMRLKELNQQ